MNKTVWTRNWPTKPGMYWFYGYRYGKISCGYECERELMLVEVIKISNGTIMKGEGQFVYKNELEDAQFLKAILPILPEIPKDCNTCAKNQRFTDIQVDTPNCEEDDCNDPTYKKWKKKVKK